MTQRRHITEYLEVDAVAGTWHCHPCGRELGPATRSYKEGCLVWDRDPRTLYPPAAEGPYTFAPDPEWYRIVEFYCPGCGTLIEAEGLPPGHPITNDIELDLAALRDRAEAGNASGADNGRAASAATSEKGARP